MCTYKVSSLVSFASDETQLFINEVGQYAVLKYCIVQHLRYERSGRFQIPRLEQVAGSWPKVPDGDGGWCVWFIILCVQRGTQKILEWFCKSARSC